MNNKMRIENTNQEQFDIILKALEELGCDDKSRGKDSTFVGVLIWGNIKHIQKNTSRV